MKILVCGRKEIKNVCLEHNVTHVLSLVEDKRTLHYYIPGSIDVDNWMHISMSDEADANRPTLENVNTALRFVDKLPVNAILLIHCEAGVSRSTAMSVVIDSYLTGETSLDILVERLVDRRPMAYPNADILEHGGSILGLDLMPIRDYPELTRLIF